MAPNHNSRRISDATRSLLAKRRQMDRENNHVEYTLLNRLCRQRLAEDLENFSRLLEAASNRRSVKKTKRELAQYRLTISRLKGLDGSRTTSRPKMKSISTNFYSILFESDHDISTEQIPIGEMVPSFLPLEVRHAIETMPKGKAAGADGLSLEALQACSHKIYCASAQRFTRYVNDFKSSTRRMEKIQDNSAVQNGRQRRLGQLPTNYAPSGDIQSIYTVPLRLNKDAT
uniref:Endonuclease-reverse transcriptase n=1 Tax=Haemonchus contortus TaxID=6289 RepID=A0A7I4YX38_HAECO